MLKAGFFRTQAAYSLRGKATLLGEWGSCEFMRGCMKMSGFPREEETGDDGGVAECSPRIPRGIPASKLPETSLITHSK